MRQKSYPRPGYNRVIVESFLIQHQETRETWTGCTCPFSTSDTLPVLRKLARAGIVQACKHCQNLDPASELFCIQSSATLQKDRFILCRARGIVFQVVCCYPHLQTFLNLSTNQPNLALLEWVQTAVHFSMEWRTLFHSMSCSSRVIIFIHICLTWR